MIATVNSPVTAAATGIDSASPAVALPATTETELYHSSGCHLQELGATGGNAAHPNLQPSLVLNYCIAIQGVYPPRS